mgnify:CR=1 FL=1
MMTDEQKELSQRRREEVVMVWVRSLRDASETGRVGEKVIDEETRDFFWGIAPVVEEAAEAAQNGKETSIPLNDDPNTPRGYFYNSVYLRGDAYPIYRMISNAVEVLSRGKMIMTMTIADKPEIRVSKVKSEKR